MCSFRNAKTIVREIVSSIAGVWRQGRKQRLGCRQQNGKETASGGQALEFQVQYQSLQ